MNIEAFDQDSYRWRDDDDSESAATWLEIINTSHDFDLSSGNVDARLRFLAQEINNVAMDDQEFYIMFQINAGGYSQLKAVSIGCVYYNSVNLTDDGSTTLQIGSGTHIDPNDGITEHGISGDIAVENDFAGNDELEVEATIRFVAVDLSNGDSIDFRLYLNAADDFTTKGNPTAGGYTQTANATITKAGASFQPAWALRSNQLL